MQLTTICSQLIAGILEACFKDAPVFARVGAVCDCCNNINYGEPPLRISLIPNGPDLAVVEESDGYLTHAFKLYIIQR